MGNYTGADLEVNFEAEDFKDMLKIAGVVIPVGEYLTIAAKPIGLYGVEITAEYQIDTSFLEEKFKYHPIYVRIVVSIFKNLKINRL